MISNVLFAFVIETAAQLSTHKAKSKQERLKNFSFFQIHKYTQLFDQTIKKKITFYNITFLNLNNLFKSCFFIKRHTHLIVDKLSGRQMLKMRPL